MSQTYFYDSQGKGFCDSCGKSTRGRLLDFDKNNLFSMCPRCRDTHSKFNVLVGVERNSVTVISLNGPKSSVSKIPVSDQLPPMLARKLASAKPDHMVDSIPKDPNWVASEKYDGVRLVMYVTESGSCFLGRNKTKTTGQYGDKSGSMVHLDLVLPELAGTVIDGEVMFSGESIQLDSGPTSNVLNATAALVNCSAEKSQMLQLKFGYLHFYAFDVLKVRNVDVRHLPWRSRRRILDKLGQLINSEYFHLEHYVQGSHEEKEGFYQEIIARGGEGVMYKDINSPYCKSPTSRPTSWVKRKVKYTGDAFITDFIAGQAGFTGMVGALVLSVFNESDEQVEVARVSNLKLLLREEITNSEGFLKMSLYGQVVEVSFQELSAKSKRGRHAILERFRPDKSKEDCTLDSLRKS